MKHRSLALITAILLASSLQMTGCGTVGTAADRTGDVVGHAARGAGDVAGDAVEGTGDAIHDTTKKAKEEID